MLAAVVGGKLQGAEVVYLAGKAGITTLLVDKRRDAPASGLCDQMACFDVTDIEHLDRVLQSTDLVIPALENKAALAALRQWSENASIPVAFDFKAYSTSCSKTASNRLFSDLSIPVPGRWPDCGYPAVTKPSTASGSDRVVVLKNETDMNTFFPNGLPGHNLVIQQYLSGPSYSLEIAGKPGNYAPLQATELFMDERHDCKRVEAPAGMSAAHAAELEKISETLAEAIQLRGLMDVEVILHEGRLKVLEIDARFPSQTPIAVFHATGLNMVEILADLFMGHDISTGKTGIQHKATILEHVRVSENAIRVEGEHIMADQGPLRLISDFFGANEAVTNYTPGRKRWVATLINTAGSMEKVRERRNAVFDRIAQSLNLSQVIDGDPMKIERNRHR